jgi:hypothetical protein
MKLSRESIQLSSLHPSLCIPLNSQPLVMTPVIVTSDHVLIDGYRRYQLCPDSQIEAMEFEGGLFETAFALNLRTRVWDETDCFLWCRWARSIGADASILPLHQFPEELFRADSALIAALASRKLAFRQFLFLCRAPARHRKSLQKLLIEDIQLNPNETAAFIETATDLLPILERKTIEEVFQQEALVSVLEDEALNPRQRGEKLLKEMRALRYPYYTKKLKEFSSSWGQLNLDQVVQVKKNFFLERGTLEISLSATSQDDLKTKILQLGASLDLSHWKKIWEI